MRKKTVVEIYALAVCFLMVAAFTVSLGLAVWNVVQMNAPDFTMSTHQYERFQSDAAYRDYLLGARAPWEQKPPARTREVLDMSEDELRREREQRYAEALLLEQRDGVQGLVRNLIAIAVAVALFLLHWRIARAASRDG